MFNVVAAVNALIGGVIITLYGYFVTCVATILSPLRIPLRRWRETPGAGSESLTSYSMLFLSSLFASSAIFTRNYRSFVAEAARRVSQSSKSMDTGLLTILLTAILIFVLSDIVARIGTRQDSPRTRVRNARLLALRHYQTAALLALVSVLIYFHETVGRQLFFSYYPDSRNSWFLSHQWALQLFTLLFGCLALGSLHRVRAGYGMLSRRTIFKIAIPPIICGTALFYALSDAPGAYLLRQPQLRISDLLNSSISSTFPEVSYARCSLAASGPMDVLAVVTNRTKYDAAVDLSFAEVVFVQGALPGYLDQEVGWFTRPRTLATTSDKDATTKVALLKSGDSVALKMTFDQPEQVAAGLELARRWTTEPAGDLAAYLSTEPTCFLSLRFINLETQGISKVPDYSVKDGFWEDLRKAAPGEVVVMDSAGSSKRDDDR